MSYQALEQVSAARSLLENLFALKEKNTAKALDKLKIFNRKHKNIKPRDLSNEDKKELQQMQREAGRRPDTMDYLMGSLLFAEGDEDGALRHFRKVEKMNVRWPSLYIKLGNVYLKMKEWKKAEISFQKVLDIDPDNSEAHLGLCRCFLPRRMNKHAAEEALQSIGLLYFSPFAHFSLGMRCSPAFRLPGTRGSSRVAVSTLPMMSSWRLAERCASTKPDSNTSSR